jgi:hypothetical protein
MFHRFFHASLLSFLLWSINYQHHKKETVCMHNAKNPQSTGITLGIYFFSFAALFRCFSLYLSELIDLLIVLADKICWLREVPWEKTIKAFDWFFVYITAFLLSSVVNCATLTQPPTIAWSKFRSE